MRPEGSTVFVAGLEETPRDKEILASFSRGMSYAAIADARGVKPGSGRRPAHRSTKNLTALSSADFFFVADTFYEAHDADVPSETVIMIDAAVYWSDPTTTRGLGKFAWDLEITGAE